MLLLLTARRDAEPWWGGAGLGTPQQPGLGMGLYGPCWRRGGEKGARSLAKNSRLLRAKSAELFPVRVNGTGACREGC